MTSPPRLTSARPRGRERWTFEPEALDHDAVDFPDERAPMRIPVPVLLQMLPDLHPNGEGWALERREGRLVRAEGGLGEALDSFVIHPAPAPR
ncbi:hypothetical protein L6R49_04775 [Myxococcota bacterium]|nr:hypothetical protein [Myxococcota bacterium]